MTSVWEIEVNREETHIIWRDAASVTRLAFEGTGVIGVLETEQTLLAGRLAGFPGENVSIV